MKKIKKSFARDSARDFYWFCHTPPQDRRRQSRKQSTPNPVLFVRKVYSQQNCYLETDMFFSNFAQSSVYGKQ